MTGYLNIMTRDLYIVAGSLVIIGSVVGGFVLYVAVPWLWRAVLA